MLDFIMVPTSHYSWSCSIFLLKGEFFFAPNHNVRNINMINESSSKCDISLNHIWRRRVEHLIMFYSSFRLLLLRKFNVTVNCYGSPPSNRDNIEIGPKGGICLPQSMTECLIMI
jgi:hypothetical protein